MNPREPGFYWRSSGTPGQVNASTAFFILFLKMTVKERGLARMSEDVEATIWRLRETIRAAELAATHFFLLFFSLISLITDGPHDYHPACGHK